MSAEGEHDVTSGAGLSRRRVVLEAIRLADRVAVLAGPPGRLVASHPVGVPRAERERVVPLPRPA